MPERICILCPRLQRDIISDEAFIEYWSVDFVSILLALVPLGLVVSISILLALVLLSDVDLVSILLQ